MTENRPPSLNTSQDAERARQATQVDGKKSLHCKVRRWAEAIGPTANTNKIQPFSHSSLISHQF